MFAKIVCREPGCGTLLARVGPMIKTTTDEYVTIPACWRCAKRRRQRPGRSWAAFVRVQRRRGVSAPYLITTGLRVPVADLRAEISKADRLPVKVPL